MMNLQQDSGSLLKITLFVHAYRKTNLKAHTTQPNSDTGNFNALFHLCMNSASTAHTCGMIKVQVSKTKSGILISKCISTT